ncbi:MAG TPA: hypothetical protein VHA13_02380, partial [Gammaproteobacteria bacterium]|nr:hypothetical protein [Gammaproteobacteria bacterium]
ASVASAKYQLPAITFDNPGIPKNQGLDLSHVISFQAPPNVVNSLAEVNMHAYDYGTKIDLPMTAKQQVTYAASTLFAAVAPGTGLFSVPALTVNSHSIDHLGQQLRW